MRTAILKIDGMGCAGCVQSVRHVLQRVPGIQGCSVSLESQQARIAYDADEAMTAAFIEALDEAGYGVTEIHES